MEKRYIIENNEKKQTFQLIQGDITEQTTDAIVNAANTDLILGAGVAGAIRRKGGSSIQEECNSIGTCEVGGSVITNGGNLKAKYVIHAVGPIYHQYSPEKAQMLLENAIKSSLKVLEEKNLSSISFPAISTGIYGFPKQKAAKIMISTIIKFLSTASSPFFVQICLFSTEDFGIFNKEAQLIFRK
ncbi:MAG: macro domain-containing protein [Promethearchaeota archaeon]